jgi:ribonucleoside-diphosphate reductase alpha chain
MNIQLNHSRDSLLSAPSLATQLDRYTLEGETVQDAYARPAIAFSDNESMAQRIYDYVSKGWFMYSTPVYMNAPKRIKDGAWMGGWAEHFAPECFEKVKGMPISCFLNGPFGDSIPSINAHYEENTYLTTRGGGIGGYWGAIRSDGVATSKGSMSNGSIPFMKVVDAQMFAFSQGKSRRGSYAAYQDVTHPEIMEFIEMRKDTGGDPNRKTLNLHHGVNLTDEFMGRVNSLTTATGLTARVREQLDRWDLIDPHTKRVTSTESVMAIWQKILETRMQTGEPYLHFIDKSNAALPNAQKRLGLRVNQSNLCSEITLPTSEDRTAVCCLSSVNLEKWDEWKGDPKFIPDLVRFLDNVIEFFTQNAPPEMSRAVFSAKQERSIGIGAMGFHAYAQSQGWSMEDWQTASFNFQAFKHIKEQAYAATQELAITRGECPDSSNGRHGIPVRNMHLLAIAPNASSGILASTSPSIEPARANVFTHKTASGSFEIRNRHLSKVLAAHGQDVESTWKSIALTEGSVQHLDFLTAIEKTVYLTATEIDQRVLVDLAGVRQQFICQAQSLNLFLPANVDIELLHHVHLRAWIKGLKSLYYMRSTSAQRAENLSTKVERVKLDDYETCTMCEG